MIVTIVSAVLFVISIILIFVGFLMAPDSNSFSGALVGSSDLELFNQVKEKGYKKLLKGLMIFFGFCLIITSILIRIFIKQ